MHAQRMAGGIALTLTLLAGLPGVTGHAQQQPAASLETTVVAEGIWALSGRGGNIGVVLAGDGVVLVDDQYAPVTDDVRAAVDALAPGLPIRFVINTHWHGDHTGGNENLAAGGSLIVAHHNVRQRLASDQLIGYMDRSVPAAPSGALPVVTFGADVAFHLGDEEVRAFHVPRAHTDGDSVVHFRTANALHLGDVFFNGIYPFIDLSSGGSIDGLVQAVERSLRLVGPETRIIPGHGPPVAAPADLEAYLAMLRGVRTEVARLRAAGKSLEETVAARPTARWDEAWADGFIPPEAFVGFIFQSLPENTACSVRCDDGVEATVVCDPGHLAVCRCDEPGGRRARCVLAATPPRSGD